MSPDRPVVRLPESELTWRFSRSSGPGGQHVNTTETRAEVLWSPGESSVLTADQKARVLSRLRGRLVDGQLSVVASAHRSQLRNREDAVQRLEELVAEALRPVKSRRPTRPTRGSVERRLDAKKRRSQIKRGRREW
ncbi:alternative ribosome rescue aminoacyl-tRNA hydrolase ArfB [Aeromicrobium duanguangcaii]|uniref:Aminoacyl-tRNA hydrolase n=1 Tax=Aeromicrobium duanguangcaii TaxID=2968086 RepID=A0ABY5KBQ1_9ACTN|nr:alternative ribosome rescue aminoacyl-tRNA hydrolase ArfB [Aeromicrobium duanguangcaii]MCD9154881.1 aminoacyl-tRNA hydrolase [Aeromicrobium duanguangcaii]MCL3839079.1 aminoacyl-tRNA hydrolase [Aeromicrobium duanguangcaii]UUI67709.1 aminoacyl-tRNA hydrolase [Aeromicrobium duanguangcaii]